MAAPEVWVFFYGSFIRFDLLRDRGFVPRRWEVARLPGFDIRMAPLANLVPDSSRAVCGILAQANHAELALLYENAQSTHGQRYLPVAVLVETCSGWRPALCYLNFEGKEEPEQPPQRSYVDAILEAARGHGFPDWYLKRLEQFTSAAR
jgi:cation transport regulator ChaC